jgi:hypothetical protein
MSIPKVNWIIDWMVEELVVIGSIWNLEMIFFLLLIELLLLFDLIQEHLLQVLPLPQLFVFK